MNKKFLNLMICSLLVGGMATNFVSCKDYDDDITEINTTTDGLSEQLKTLSAALDAAKADAAAAQSSADAAKAAADAAADAATKAQEAAKAAAEEAKAAAAQAKAEAIQEAMTQIENLQKQINANKGISEQNAKDIAALAGRIDGIEKGLANIDLTDINKQLGEQKNFNADVVKQLNDQSKLIAEANEQIQALKTQIKALEAYGDQIKGINADIAGINGEIADIKSQLAAIETIKADLKTALDKAQANADAIAALDGKVAANSAAIAENKAAIADLKGELATLSAKISTEVTNAINTIAGVISQRLTSVTLIPDLYVNGIPTISFESAQYTKKVFRNNAWVNATTGVTNFIITNNATEVRYRLNPGTVTENDVKMNELAFVSNVAVSRAESTNDLINVADRAIAENGILTLKLGKSNTSSLNRTDGKINTVALRVPIADKHLFTEQGETSANVYSEYSRLEETYFLPEIAYVPGKNLGAPSITHPYTDSLAVYNSAADANIARTMVFNKEYNLYDLIEGCKFFAPDRHDYIDMDKVRAYGMDIKFAVATRAYQPTADKTNQQEWVKLSGDNNNILTPVTNVASGSKPGNEAIIGKQPIIRATLIDVTNGNVIDVRYFKVKFTAVEMQPEVFDWTIDVNGDPCNGASVNMTWDEVASKILVNLNGGKGMSKEDFYKIYGTNYTVAPANDDNGTFTATVSPELSASIPVFTWSADKELLGKLKVGKNEITFTKTVTFTNTAGLYPDVVIKFKYNVTTNVNEVTLGATDGVKWQNNTMLVYVVPMTIPYDGVQAHYATNILEGRTQPYVKGLTSCATYDIDYAPVSGYVGEALTFNGSYGHWSMTKANQNGLTEVIYSIANTAAGRAIASNGKEIKINWSNDINGLKANPDNRYVFGTVNLKVLPILNLNPQSGASITDNSAVQTATVKVTITDAYKNLVAQANTSAAPYAADYWKFYGVEDPTFNGTIMIADDANGSNSRSLSSLNMTANVDASGVLTFQNNGAPIQSDAYLMVPVQVKHLWGTLEGKIAVKLNKNGNLNTTSK